MLVGLFFLNTLPILCFAFFGVRLILEMYWRAFAVQNTVTEPEPRGLVAMAGRITICVLVIVAALIFCLAADNLIGAQAAAAVFGYAAVLGYTLSRNPSTDVVVLGVMGPVQAVAMLWASDLITMFFVLEFTNALVLYSMLFSATYLGLSGKGYAARISTAFVYQFVINFFSSIILYVSVTRFVAVTGSADLTNLSVWVNSPEVSGPLSAFILAFLIKFGTGPWIFYKINIYRNMNFYLAAIYTLVYVGVIFMFFLNLFFVFGVSLTGWAKAAIVLLICAASTLFGGFAFQTPNIFTFFSFSTLLNISMFMLQLLSVLYV